MCSGILPTIGPIVKKKIELGPEGPEEYRQFRSNGKNTQKKRVHRHCACIFFQFFARFCQLQMAEFLPWQNFCHFGSGRKWKNFHFPLYFRAPVCGIDSEFNSESIPHTFKQKILKKMRKMKILPIFCHFLPIFCQILPFSAMAENGRP